MRTRIALTLLTLVAGACSGSDTESTLPPTAEQVLEAAAATMGAVDTVQFSIERGGAPVYIDTQGFLEFVSATGRYAAPGAAEAVVKVSAVGLNAEIGAVVIEGKTWLTNPITSNWEPTPPGYAFDPATLFDPAMGWRLLLVEGIPTVVDLGDEASEDTTLRHVRFTASAPRVEVITAGLVRGEEVLLDVWIEPVSGEVREARFATPFDDGLTDWRLILSDYGSDIEITPPNLGD